MRMLDPKTGIFERMVEEDGKLHIQRSENIQSLIDANKALADVLPSMHGDAKLRLVGRIPATVAEQWAAECGAGIGTKEFLAYCKRKLLDGDFAAFRVKGV